MSVIAVLVMLVVLVVDYLGKPKDLFYIDNLPKFHEFP
jgi:hypothetical protein